MTSPKIKEAEVLGAEQRQRWSASEKVAMVRETYEPGMTVSLVARRHGINPNQLCLTGRYRTASEPHSRAKKLSPWQKSVGAP
jgi:transposase-like protein